MKKVVALLLCCLLINLIMGKKEKIVSVFEEESTQYHLYELTFENKQLSTLNMGTYFSNYKIIAIEPYISSVYKYKMRSIEHYSFIQHQSVDQNITKFQHDYIDMLEQLGYRKEALKVQMNGVFINKIIIYIEFKDISHLQQAFPTLKWKETNI